jgi:hypothetical protein
MVVNQGWTEVETALAGDRLSSSTVGVRAHDSGRSDAVGNGREVVGDGCDEHIDRLLLASHCRELVGEWAMWCFAIRTSIFGARAKDQNVGQRGRAGSAKKRGGGPVKSVALERKERPRRV